jgi:hypothetical protein
MQLTHALRWQQRGKQRRSASTSTQRAARHMWPPMNADLETTLEALQGLLAASLKAGHVVSFSSLKKPASKPPWKHAHLERAEPAPVPETFMPAPLAGMGKLFGKAKHEQAVAAGQARYEQAVKEHHSREAQRASALKKALGKIRERPKGVVACHASGRANHQRGRRSSASKPRPARPEPRAPRSSTTAGGFRESCWRAACLRFTVSAR